MMRAGIVAILLVVLFYIVASGLALFAVTRDKNKPAVTREMSDKPQPQVKKRNKNKNKV